MRRNLSSDAVRSNIGSSLLNQKIMGRIVDISQGITAEENDDSSNDNNSVKEPTEDDTEPNNETQEEK